MKFLKGDIADYTDDHADMVVTLHACDTATDYALINAVAWNTKVILSVPCCQHELFKQIKNDLHKPILKHGILKDRFTEYLTDGLRGLKLEACGYDVAMIEFTSLGPTRKRSAKPPSSNIKHYVIFIRSRRPSANSVGDYSSASSRLRRTSLCTRRFRSFTLRITT